MKPTVVDPEARLELEAAAQWYEDRSQGLGAEFLDRVGDAVMAIQKYPKAFPHFRSTEIRKYVMRKFPYVLFFEEFETHIAIYAIAHGKRKPGYWLGRTAQDE